MSELKPEQRPEPIWYRPGWITVMVGVVSLFLTVPEMIAEYLEKEQEIELARQMTEQARLANLSSSEEREFHLVSNTLAEQGSERVFVLRYLAATLDDEAARSWADREVQRLDELAAKEEQLRAAKADMAAREADLQTLRARGENVEGLEAEIEQLITDLAARTAEVTELRAKAGIWTKADIGGEAVIETQQHPQPFAMTYSGLITFDSPEHPPVSVTPSEHTGRGIGPDFSCPPSKRCEISSGGRAPNMLRITPGSSFLSIAVQEMNKVEDGRVLDIRDVRYICEIGDSTLCYRSPMLSSPAPFAKAE